jgi:hypothetical protein
MGLFLAPFAFAAVVAALSWPRRGAWAMVVSFVATALLLLFAVSTAHSGYGRLARWLLSRPARWLPAKAVDRSS